MVVRSLFSIFGSRLLTACIATLPHLDTLYLSDQNSSRHSEEPDTELQAGTLCLTSLQ